jgi:hypothetical protein
VELTQVSGYPWVTRRECEANDSDLACEEVEMSGILLLPPSTPSWHAQEQFSIFFLPVEKLRIGSLPCADRAYKPLSNSRPVRLSRISTCYADLTFGFMRMDKKRCLCSFLGHKMVVRRLTKEQMSEFNCKIIYCGNIPNEQTAHLPQRHRSPIQNSSKQLFIPLLQEDGI